MKIILQKNTDLNKNDFDKIKKLGFSIQYYNNEEVAGDIFVGYPSAPFTALKHIKGLKFIQSLMAGYDHLNLDEIKAKGIVFANASGVSSTPIAEYVVLKILDYYKDAQYFRNNQKASLWKKRDQNERKIKELYKRKALILGTGHIGSEIAKRLQAFGVFVIGINSNGSEVKHFDKTYPLKDVLKHLKIADFVVGALPLNKDTKNLYDKQFFMAMDKEAVFINVGRGSQLVQMDLMEVLDNHLGHVYLDVVPTEPLDRKSKLWTHPKISITPHISASSDYIVNRIRDLVINNMQSFKADEKIRNRVV